VGVAFLRSPEAVPVLSAQDHVIRQGQPSDSTVRAQTNGEGAFLTGKCKISGWLFVPTSGVAGQIPLLDVDFRVHGHCRWSPVKHQYFGDINDYRKYGLLRLLAREGGLRLGICWMLTPDDDRADGGRISYLADPELWRPPDPDLYDHLAAALKGGSSRALTTLETADLIPGAWFHSDLLQDGAGARADYIRAMLERFQGVDLVFFDPDNGMEVKSCPIGRKDSSKFLAYKEAAETFHSGASLLIYQHFGRVEREVYVREEI